MEPIRILHVTGSMDFGGAETLIMSMYRNINRERVQFDFAENTLEKAAFDEEILSLGGRIFKCPHYTGKNHLAYTKWWRSFFDAHAGEFAAVHGHIGSTAAIYLKTAKKHGLFTIAHSHNTNGIGFSDLVYRAYSYPTRFIADQFFACSRQAGIDRYGEKIGKDPKRCIQLHNAIDTARFAYNPELREKTRNALGLSEDALVIGHIGRFVQQKNHEFLVEIFAELVKQAPSARLLLLGTGETEPQIRKQVEALGLSDRVIFAGTHKATSPYYQAMDVFVLPSLFEGLGIVNIEAQTAGLPCVISDQVAPECMLAEDLVSVCRLSDPPRKWAEHILSVRQPLRSDHSDIVKSKGYDVKSTALWLENFYFEVQSR